MRFILGHIITFLKISCFLFKIDVNLGRFTYPLKVKTTSEGRSGHSDVRLKTVELIEVKKLPIGS